MILQLYGLYGSKRATIFRRVESAIACVSMEFGNPGWVTRLVPSRVASGVCPKMIFGAIPLLASEVCRRMKSEGIRPPVSGACRRMRFGAIPGRADVGGPKWMLQQGRIAASPIPAVCPGCEVSHGQLYLPGRSRPCSRPARAGTASEPHA